MNEKKTASNDHTQNKWKEMITLIITMSSTAHISYNNEDRVLIFGETALTSETVQSRARVR